MGEQGPAVVFLSHFVRRKGTTIVKSLNQEAIGLIENLTDLEKTYCLKMLDRLKHLGVHEHANHAVCAVATASAMPIKK